MNITDSFQIMSYLSSNLWTKGLAFIEKHPVLLTMVLAVVGYKGTIHTYRKSVCPVVVPTKLDPDNMTITIKNSGKWHAQNIQTMKITHFIDWGLITREYHTAFKSPAFLEPGSSITLETIADENGKKVSNPEMLLYAQIPTKASPKDSEGKLRQLPFHIEYEDVDGTKYVTKSVIEEGQFKNISVSPDFILARWWRYFKEALHYRYVWTKFQIIQMTKKYHRTKISNDIPNTNKTTPPTENQ